MTRKKAPGRMYIWIIILLFVVLACLVWYFFDRQIEHIDKKLEESRAIQ